VDQERADVLVAALADPEQLLLAAGAMLARRQTERDRQVPAILELPRGSRARKVARKTACRGDEK
jgi:hypothetical protein